MIAIIGFNDLNIMQYLNKYTNILDAEDICYDVIWWNRSGINNNVTFKGNSISFNFKMNTYQPFYMKIRGFLKYAAFARNVIKQKKYNKLIVLTTQTAIPLYDLLTKQYTGRFIYDYRDLTKEKKSKFYTLMIRNLFQKSRYTMISSKGFLPEIGITDNETILMAHNTQKICQKSNYQAKKNSSEPLRIVYWGMVRQIKHNKLLCDCFGNDKRFELTYHGDGFYKELRAYCQKKGYQNITFTGKYTLADIPKFINNTDILNCIYENDLNTKPTLAVKFYDAIHYRLPILVSSGSYLSEFSRQCSGVKNINIKCREMDTVYSWYKQLDIYKLEKDYENIENKIYQDDIIFSQKFIEFIKENDEI